jgi:hypothetical protein
MPGVVESIIRGWLPMEAFDGPFIGGTSRDRRLRDARDSHGIPFESSIINGLLEYYKIHIFNYMGKKYSRCIYRLAVDLTPGDFEEMFSLNAKYFYVPKPEPIQTPEPVKHKTILRPVEIREDKNKQLQLIFT